MKISRESLNYWISNKDLNAFEGKGYRSVFLCVLVLFSVGFSAQKKTDSIPKQEYVDTLHKPKVATIFSAILPSGGQIYNQVYKIEGQRKHLWWKLPIIYGGLGTVTYLTIFNHQEFTSFRNERLNRLNDSYDHISGPYPGLGDSQLKVYQDQYERWRNLSIIGGLGIYALQLIDANVEAHLMHFDTSDDLAISFMPSIHWQKSGSAVYGMSVRISFK